MLPCHIYIQKKFRYCHCCKGALCVCFDLAKVFLQSATMPSLHQIFWNCHYCGKGIMLLLLLSQGISSGCHHATFTPKKFQYCHYCCKGPLCVCFDLAKVFLQSVTMPSLHHFLELSLLWALCFCFELAGVFLQVATMPPYTHFLELSIGST